MKYQTCQNSIRTLWKKDKMESTLTVFQMLQNYINSSLATIFVGFVFCSFFSGITKPHSVYFFLVLKDHIIYLSWKKFLFCFANVIIF